MSRGNACTLQKVVPIAQRREASGITVALSALEIYESGEGILRYFISHDPQRVFKDPFGGGPEPEIEIKDGSGRGYGWGMDGSSGGGGETEGTLEMYDLPRSGDLEIKVVRVISTEPPEGVVSEAHEGPWEFHVSM